MPGGYHHRPGLPPQGDIYTAAEVTKKPKKEKTSKRQRQGRKGKKMAKGKKPKMVRIKPGVGAGSAGKATVAYPTPAQTTGGALGITDLNPLAQVGLTAVMAELVNHGRVTVGGTLASWQREQDRITNRTWRRPGGMQRPAGL